MDNIVYSCNEGRNNNDKYRYPYGVRYVVAYKRDKDIGGQKHKKDGIFRETWQTWKDVCGKKEQKSLGEF